LYIDQEIDILRSLPIYSSFTDSDSAAAPAPKRFFALSPLSPSSRGGQAISHQTLGDKERLSAELFPSHFVRYRDQTELSLLRALKVPVLSRLEYFRGHLLPGLALTFPLAPALVARDMLEMLAELPALLEADHSFGPFLAAAAFVPFYPDAATDADADADADADTDATGDDGLDGEDEAFPTLGGRGEASLCRPGQLYDPRDAELRSLLGEAALPAPAFRREDILVHLGTLGLRTSLDWPGIVSCARSIAEGSAPPASRSRRGESLLRFLDRNTTSLLDPPVAKPSKESRRGSGLGLKAMLFGPSSKEAAETSRFAEELARFVDPAPYLQVLNALAWVSVREAPEGGDYGMPWARPTPATTPAPATAPGFTPAPAPALAAPNSSRPYADAWLCSASLSLSKRGVRSERLLAALGWTRPLPCGVIATQLRELSILYDTLKASQRSIQDVETDSDPSCAASDSGTDGVNKFQALRERITALIPNLYQRLNAVSAGPPTEELLLILRGVSWIWVGDSFVPVGRVAFESPVNFSPYLHLVPQDLCVYSRLLTAFGVRQAFSSRDLIGVLERMAVESGACADGSSPAPAAAAPGLGSGGTGAGAGGGGNSRSITTSTSAPLGRALTEQQLDLAVSLASQLNADTADASGLVMKNLAVYLPDQQSHLVLSYSLVIDDVPWLSGPEYTAARQGIQFLHNNIANKFASKIGIRSLRMLLVDRSVELFSAPAEEGGAMEAFGQAESLTSRLKTILDMYPDGNPILSGTALLP
jgi:hypothetical protein